MGQATTVEVKGQTMFLVGTNLQTEQHKVVPGLNKLNNQWHKGWIFMSSPSEPEETGTEKSFICSISLIDFS